MAFSTAQPATAQQAASEPTKTEPANADLAKVDLAKVDLGKAVFAEKCSHCHGPNMVNSGTVTPDLRRFPDDNSRFVTTVKQGKNNKMPPWGDILNDDDIANLWAYVSSRRSQ
ncbi:MAG TPA: cytochrome c [Bradyrhizobium sp.]|nr:cytochrome c [Bradyrhizobium sp.]